MGDFGKCETEDCENTAIYMVLMEGREDWTKSETKKLCEECLSKKAAVIETWTWHEWDEGE